MEKREQPKLSQPKIPEMKPHKPNGRLPASQQEVSEEQAHPLSEAFPKEEEIEEKPRHPGSEHREGSLRRNWRWTAAVFLLLSIFLSWLFIRSPHHAQLDSQEKRGRQIYFEGTSPGGGEIKAYIGQAQVGLPGSAATCGSCHGPDGRGRPEAGVIPSDITWDHLMKRYGHTHLNGRKHPAFTEASLKKCILTGYDPGGNRLDVSMPTYSMSTEDINALTAYMRRLQSDLDPGITETSVRIGTIVPTEGKMVQIGRGVLEVTAAYFEEINSRGGIYNRRLELVKSSFDNTKDSALSNITRLVEEGDVFAMTGAVIAGADREVAQLVESKKIPLIGPLTLFSSDPFSLNEYTFYLFSGLNEQARALVNFAAQHLKLDRLRIAVLGSDYIHERDVKVAIEEQSRAHGWTSAASVYFSGDSSQASAMARNLKEARTDALFCLGFGGLQVLLEEAERINWRPYVFMLGAHAKEEMFLLPPGFQKKIYLSYPILPSDQAPFGIPEFRTLLEKHRISTRYWSSQVSALVAAKILVEGLKGAGRDLSREKFIRSLEQLYQFQTGLTPPITFGPNRRIGALGAYVVTIDFERKTFVPVGGWIPVSAM
jgi:ABC-type branched-subunit amino acid transport system substrate-binding protein